MRKLKDREEITICRNHVTVRVGELEFTKELNCEGKKTHTQRIHENLPLYVKDLDRPGMEISIMSNPIIRNNWEEKFTYLCNILKDEKFNKRTNSDTLELYIQIGELLAKKGWCESVKNKLNLYFNNTVQDLNISILSYMSEKDFNEVLLVEAKRLKEKEMTSRDSQELILQRGDDVMPEMEIQ
ncbi:18825_t:CDS:2 [Racocetra fulgida]|uniref:18825_t:CDS:1 n=1 Tax=Racocetra fulgida TaxID=60492 RepID=A0A9N9G8Z5_9GLOM|nr:18825_t:CDS:2 [Racocetra fulgida]